MVNLRSPHSCCNFPHNLLRLRNWANQLTVVEPKRSLTIVPERTPTHRVAPKRVIEGISSLVALPTDAFTALVRNLSSLRPQLGFASDVARAVEKSVSADLAANATHSILWFYSARIERKVPLPEFVQNVIDALQDVAVDIKIEGLTDQSSNWSAFPAFLSGTTAKRSFLSTNDSCSARA